MAANSPQTVGDAGCTLLMPGQGAGHGNGAAQRAAARLLRLSTSSDGKRDEAAARRAGLPRIPSVFALASLKNSLLVLSEVTETLAGKDARDRNETETWVRKRLLAHCHLLS